MDLHQVQWSISCQGPQWTWHPVALPTVFALFCDVKRVGGWGIGDFLHRFPPNGIFHGVWLLFRPWPLQRGDTESPQRES